MAYTNKLVSKTPVKGTQNTRLSFAFTSDTPASEPPFSAEFIATPETTEADLSAWAWRQGDGGVKRASFLASLTVGQAVPMVAPVEAEAVVEP